MPSRIKNSLHNALLLDEAMSQELYEFELEEHLNFWKKGLIKDKEDFVFVVTENKGDVAIVLITREELFINENARHQLRLYWKGAYEKYIESMLPSMVKELSNERLPVTGVKITT